jgi:hypothetical protein
LPQAEAVRDEANHDNSTNGETRAR